MKKTIVKVYNVVAESLLQSWTAVKEFIKNETGNIIFVMQIFFPVLLSESSLSFSGKVIASFVTLFLLSTIKKIWLSLCLREDTGFPVVHDKYTYQEGNLISIIPGKESEAIAYLAKIESYYESIGKMKK